MVSPYFNTHFLNCECQVAPITAGGKEEPWGLLGKGEHAWEPRKISKAKPWVQ